MMRERVLCWLADNVPQARLKHILGVEEMAVQLACDHGVDVDKASIAGLMHDLAKHFKPQRLLSLAQANGLEIDPVQEADPHLLHADVSAIVASDVFGVYDEEILQAIRYHTLGSPGMSLLSCVVFLADSLEASRGDTPELLALRQLSRCDLYAGVWRTCDYSMGFLLETRKLIHPRTILTRNWALQLATSKLHPLDLLKSA